MDTNQLIIALAVGALATVAVIGGTAFVAAYYLGRCGGAS